MAVAYLPLGSADELREQIVEVALDRAFLAEPLPADAAAFARRIDEGRGRLTLIANEVARLAGVVLAEYHAVLRKLKDARPAKDVADDIAQQLERLVPKRFVADTPWAQLAHLPRYLKAIAMRLDKLRADPARDARAWPSCGRSSSATCASSPSGAARATRASTSSAGGSRSCASACSRRS